MAIITKSVMTTVNSVNVVNLLSLSECYVKYQTGNGKDDSSDTHNFKQNYQYKVNPMSNLIRYSIRGHTISCSIVKIKLGVTW